MILCSVHRSSLYLYLLLLLFSVLLLVVVVVMMVVVVVFSHCGSTSIISAEYLDLL